MTMTGENSSEIALSVNGTSRTLVVDNRFVRLDGFHCGYCTPGL
jgi:xanthine dehydrogenase iron-sulfur cluster and FAD-binding subunit A